MKKASGLYDIWVKGSQSNDGAIGTAWKIVHAGDAKTGSASPRLDKNDKRRGADIAELIAVKSALDQIPAGAEVHLRLSADNVIDMLAMGRQPRKDAPDGLKAAFGNAMTAIDRLSSFQVTKAGGRRNDHMSYVRELAQAASGNASREAARALHRS